MHVSYIHFEKSQTINKERLYSKGEIHYRQGNVSGRERITLSQQAWQRNQITAQISKVSIRNVACECKWFITGLGKGSRRHRLRRRHCLDSLVCEFECVVVKYSIVVNRDLAGTCFGIHRLARKERMRAPSPYISGCHRRLLRPCYVRYS